MKNIVILGANSAMARAFGRMVANSKTQLVLAGRNVEELDKTAGDIELRCQAPKPLSFAFDAMDYKSHQKFLDNVIKKVKHIHEVYLFFGQMYEQVEAQKEFALAEKMIAANYTGVVSILEKIATHMEASQEGLIAGISSVAGDRGRQSNYLYGSTKAAMTTYLQGLRNRLVHSNIHVMTVRPGFVDTPMTAHLKKGLLFASPEMIAKGIVKGAAKNKNDIYLPFFWKWIMLIIRSIPEGIFKRLKL